MQGDHFLMSYVSSARPWVKHSPRYTYDTWALDSGAFSAKTTGVVIDNEKFIDDALRMKADDARLIEVFALDDIDDWRKSRRNAERAWARGLEAIPTFHFGEPWDVLMGYAKDFPKIALGGIALAGMTKKRGPWIGQCFARVWPKRIHGFGVHQASVLLAYPFESADATSWKKPERFKSSVGGLRVRTRDAICAGVRSEADDVRALQKRVAARWATAAHPFKRLYFAGCVAGNSMREEAFGLTTGGKAK